MSQAMVQRVSEWRMLGHALQVAGLGYRAQWGTLQLLGPLTPVDDATAAAIINTISESHDPGIRAKTLARWDAVPLGARTFPVLLWLMEEYVFYHVITPAMRTLFAAWGAADFDACMSFGHLFLESHSFDYSLTDATRESLVHVVLVHRVGVPADTRVVVKYARTNLGPWGAERLTSTLGSYWFIFTGRVGSMPIWPTPGQRLLELPQRALYSDEAITHYDALEAVLQRFFFGDAVTL
jgi:hypothetical protein